MTLTFNTLFAWLKPQHAKAPPLEPLTQKELRAEIRMRDELRLAREQQRLLSLLYRNQIK